MISEQKTLLIFTAADIWRDRKSRREEYKLGYSSVIKHLPGLEIIYLETFKKKKSVLELFGPVFYSNSHKRGISNKGVNLIRALQSLLSCKESLFVAENVIVMTGRYQILSDKFHETLLAESVRRDFIGREFQDLAQVHTGLFMIKTKLLIQFVNSVDLEEMERKRISIENELWSFMSQNDVNCLFLPKLDLYAPVFGTGVRDPHVL